MSDVMQGSTGVRVRIQQFGRFLSGMVMPNLGAFIAWGLITALEEQGRRVPGDISVAGFDGLEPDFTAHLKVLSTVVFDRFVIGHEGFLTLRRLISGQTAKSWQLPPKWRAGETLAVLKSQR